MFVPPRCPNVACEQHTEPADRFYRRHGFYRAKCRPHPIPRFVCKSCERGFSRQTFRMDYRDHRPNLNAPLFLLFATGLGLRQASRNLGLTLRCTELKFRKVARHLRNLNLNVRGPLMGTRTLQFDELETHEGRRNTRPLTLPMLIDKESRFVIWAMSAPIRPRGKMTDARRRAIAQDGRRHGPRRDKSMRANRAVLTRGAQICRKLKRVVLETDEKSSYPNLAARAFGRRRLTHHRTSSKLPRTTWNPLFPINHTEAMVRDLMSRLRRRSWLASKHGWCLDLHLQLFMTYRNYVRYRFNGEAASPAQLLGFVDQRMTPQHVLSWRQDWGPLSIHPLAAA